ncbi:unnamed protein product [Enterobius vermicularis]|uniref:Lipid-A-disaccharide synthase n=1 Tax=Enterobius vermicularis TaxID=51028 RepID=A0A0N4VF91_ENTVE|nr:unnamed protein product [Enterobius vermicularis]
MGNKMFMYAAVRGLAEKFGALVAVPADLPLLKSFRLSAFVIDSEQYTSLLKLNEKRLRTEFLSLGYEEKVVKKLFSDSNSSLETMRGYFESFKYFVEYTCQKAHILQCTLDAET